MKKEARLVYKELSEEIRASLCTFCKHSEWESDGCCEGYSICQHPLEYRFPFFEEMLEPGSDCWGFRPNVTVSLAADIAGAILSQGFNEWFYRKYSPTSASVYGRHWQQGIENAGKVRIG